MKTSKKLKKILAVSLIMAICVALLPTSAFASSYAGSFDKTVKIEKKFRIKIAGKKTKVKLNFGKIRVKGDYTLEDGEKTISYVKIYHGSKLITEGEVDKDGVSVGRGFNVKVKGFKFRVTPCVKYYPAWGCFGLSVNVKGNGLDYDIPIVTLGAI